MADLFGSLTNVFTGAPQVKAAEDQRAALAAAQAAEAARLKQAQDTGIGALQSGQTGAVGAISGGIGTGRADISGTIPEATGALYGGQSAGVGALTSGQVGGLEALNAGVGGAIGAYGNLGDLSSKYGTYGDTATNTLLGAYGLGGPEQQAAATAAFHTDPGYGFSVGQGLDAITRAANVGGQVAGGNVLRESQTFGQGLADQQYQNWLKNIQTVQQEYSPLEASTAGTVAGGTATPYLTGGTGAANIYTGTAGKLSDLYSNTGTNAAGVYTGTGKSLADLAQTGGLATGNVYTGTGSGIAGLVSGLSGQQTTYDQANAALANKTYQDAAAAQTGGSQNLWNLIGGGVQLAAGGGFIPGANLAQAFGPLAPKKAS